MQQTNKTLLPSLTAIIHETYALVVKNYKMLVPVTAVSAILSVILIIGFFSFAGEQLRSGSFTGLSSLTSVIVLAIALVLIAFAIQILSGIIIIEVLARSGETERYSFSQAFYYALSRFWAMVGLTILVAVFFLIFSLLGDILTGIIGIVVSAISSSWTNFGFFLSDLLGILITVIIGLWFVFAPYFLIVEKKSIWSSITGSFLLVHGRWFAVFIRILLVYILVFGFAVLMRFVPYVGGALVAFFAPIFISGYLYVLFLSLKKI